MTKVKLKSLEALSKNKFLSLYQADFELDNQEQLAYYVASRRELSLENFQDKLIDAVTVFAVNQSHDKFLMVREFRYPINGYAYSVPSGLIDPGEDEAAAALRELAEETGYSSAKVIRVLPATYSTVGMTNERVAPVIVEIDDSINTRQDLGQGEVIDYFWVNQEEALDYVLNCQNLTARTQLALLLFAKGNL
ncbi:NUDIX domain-containing protein [Streptococcus dentiloxodontae]